MLAKSGNPERMAQNSDVFYFELTEEDNQQIAKLDVKASQFFSHADPEMIRSLSARILDMRYKYSQVKGLNTFILAFNLKG